MNIKDKKDNMMENTEKNKVLPSTLYLVGTPIGNLSDISERAKKVLSEVDFIAAEDTRNSMKLLSVYGIKKEMLSYFEHNKKSSGERIISRLSAGESCALITDAGMPAISDPGEDIVKLAYDSGLNVSIIPGPCAAVSALALSALSTRKFTFEGFLSAQKSDRRRELDELSLEHRTMIFYEAPHKLKATLADMKDFFGAERRISLCRELTKLNEEVFRTTLGGAVEFFDENEPRGEYVLIVEGSQKSNLNEELLSLSIPEHIEHYITQGLTKKDAIKAVAKDRGLPKSDVYKYTI